MSSLKTSGPVSGPVPGGFGVAWQHTARKVGPQTGVFGRPCVRVPSPMDPLVRGVGRGATGLRLRQLMHPPSCIPVGKRRKPKTMAKLYFHYSTMNAGKSTVLLQASHNYRERGMQTYLLTAKLDHRAGEGRIASRIRSTTKLVG